jgi:hypothetical protein
MKLVNFNEVIFVVIDLFEYLLQCQALLLQNLHQMVENLVLSNDSSALTLDVQDTFGIVHLIELIKLFEQYNPVLIRVDLLEQRTHLFGF